MLVMKNLCNIMISSASSEKGLCKIVLADEKKKEEDHRVVSGHAIPNEIN